VKERAPIIAELENMLEGLSFDNRPEVLGEAIECDGWGLLLGQK
jgi:hypothetical protein